MATRALSQQAFIERLRAAVDAAGSQEAFARQIGVKQQMINQVLSGERPPSRRIAEAIGYRRALVFIPEEGCACQSA